MRRETITFEIEYKVFEPGEKVRPTSNRHCLPDGIYSVVRCECPTKRCPDTLESIVFVEGHQYGVDTEYLLPVDHSVFNCQQCGAYMPPNSRSYLGTCAKCSAGFEGED